MGTLSGIIDNFSTLMTGLNFVEQSERVPLKKAVGSQGNATFQIRVGHTEKAEGFYSDNTRIDFKSIIFIDMFYKKNFTSKTLYKTLADNRETTVKELEAVSNQASNQISTTLERANFEEIDDNVIMDTLEFIVYYKVTR